METNEIRFAGARRNRNHVICIVFFSSVLLLLMVTFSAIAQVQCGCDGCHGNPPTVDTKGGPNGLVGMGLGLGLYSGAHDHFTKLKQNLICENCHYGGMGNSSLVLDMKLQIGFDINGKPNPGASYDGSPSLIDPAYSYQATNGTILTQNGSLKCFNVYCHGGGTGGTNNAGGISKSVFLNKFTDPRSIAASTSPAWNNLTPLGCGYCHGVGTSTGMPLYNQDQPKSNSHDSHDGVKCNGCHYATTTDGVTITDVTRHHNGIYDVSPGLGMDGQPVSFIYTYDPGGGKCTEVSCHGGFAKTWGNQGRSVYLTSSAGTACYQVNITAKNNAAGPPPYVYEWDFGDNAFESGTSNTLPVTTTHTYAKTGTYTVVFNFRDGNSHPGDKSANIIPKPNINTPAVADSVKPVSVKGYTVTLTDLSSDLDYNTCGRSGCGKIWINWGDSSVTNESLCLTDKPSNKVYTHTYAVKYSGGIGHCVTDNSGTSTCESPALPVIVPSTFTISGNITHAGGGGYPAGQPYNGALVDVYRKSGAWAKGGFADSSGNFSITLDETEHYDVIPDKSGSSGFTFAPTSRDVYTNASDVNFVATP